MTAMTTKPVLRPKIPHFSSGPCAKRPGWALKKLQTESLGRSHRSKIGKARLKRAIDLTRSVLKVPAEFRIGIVPASDTGAVEMAMWTMLGQRGVDLLAWESFGEGWVTDAVKQLKLTDARVITAPYGELPKLKGVDARTRDVVLTWNGTTSGVRLPDADFISTDREGVVICDATSAAFAQDIDWAKVDVVTFSWQKVLGGEAAHGMLILSPRAVARLESYKPAWPLPKIFRLTSGGKLISGIFEGETINTPSMLAVEDYIDALEWAETVGGLDGLMKRANANARVIANFVKARDWIDFLAVKPKTRSNTSVCLKITDPTVVALSPEGQANFAKALVTLLEKEGVAFDIGHYRDAPPGLRIWCGATVQRRDVAALMPWLDWAYATAKADLAKRTA
jgi:phosphoserine aminotransferase